MKVRKQMSVLEHLIKDVTLEDNNNDLQYKGWLPDQSSVRVLFTRRVALDDYVYEDANDREILIEHLEFTVHCEAIYDVKSEDVKLGQTSIIETNKIAYRRFSDSVVESHEQLDALNLFDDVLLRLEYQDLKNSIDFEIPRALITFVDL